MKITLIACLCLVFTSCTQNVRPKSETALPASAVRRSEIISPPPVVQPISENKKTEDKRRSEEHWKRQKENIKSESRKLGFVDLEKIILQKDDLEIRIWRHFSYISVPYQNLTMKNCVFVLKRSSGNWSAVIVRNTNADTEKKIPAKRIKTELEEPKSGWENVWGKLVAGEILTLPNGIDVGVVTCPDCWSLSVEAKVGENYRFYHYDEDYLEGYEQAKEFKQKMARIANTVVTEFNIKELTN